MPKQIEFEGQIHEFPDDFTDADIAAALGGGGAAKPQEEAPGLLRRARDFMTTPLAPGFEKKMIEAVGQNRPGAMEGAESMISGTTSPLGIMTMGVVGKGAKMAVGAARRMSAARKAAQAAKAATEIPWNLTTAAGLDDAARSAARSGGLFDDITLTTKEAKAAAKAQEVLATAAKAKEEAAMAGRTADLTGTSFNIRPGTPMPTGAPQPTKMFTRRAVTEATEAAKPIEKAAKAAKAAKAVEPTLTEAQAAAEGPARELMQKIESRTPPKKGATPKGELTYAEKVQRAASAEAEFARQRSRLAKLADGEEGGLTLQAVKDAIETANQVRVASMLSGAAVPKNILGGTGAVVSSAIERGTFKPIRELLRVSKNWDEFKAGFKAGTNPSQMSGAGTLNVPGRVIGAIDQTFSKLLQRSGEPLENVQRLLLTKPGASPLKDKPLSRVVLPFQNTQFNQLIEGFSGENWNTVRKAMLTATTMAGSAAAGAYIENHKGLTRPQKVLALGLLGAFQGPRAVPGMIAAGLGGAGTKATSGLSPVPEWAFPSDAKDVQRMFGLSEPQAKRVWDVLQGEKSGSGQAKKLAASRPRR